MTHIQSMTGYGQTQYSNESITIHIEIKTINAKSLDIHCKVPTDLQDKEQELKNLVAKNLLRGKVYIHIDYTILHPPATAATIDTALFKKYYQDLTHVAQEVKAVNSPIFELALKMPQVIHKSTTVPTDMTKDWPIILDNFSKALMNCCTARLQEGQHLAKSIEENKKNIQFFLEKIIALAPQRTKKIKKSIQEKIKHWQLEDIVDENRLEQEIFFYIDKMDIEEEIIRLQSHLTYFENTMQKEQVLGKKLSFIAQEIGREINTIGAKANDAELQKLTVLMKDSLEKIKEQILNIV